MFKQLGIRKITLFTSCCRKQRQICIDIDIWEHQSLKQNNYRKAACSEPFQSGAWQQITKNVFGIMTVRSGYEYEN